MYTTNSLDVSAYVGAASVTSAVVTGAAGSVTSTEEVDVLMSVVVVDVLVSEVVDVLVVVVEVTVVVVTAVVVIVVVAVTSVIIAAYAGRLIRCTLSVFTSVGVVKQSTAAAVRTAVVT